MRNYIKIWSIVLIGYIVFLSIGFSSFSANLTIDDIKASVKPTKNIRVTNFYAANGYNDGNSSWEEFSPNRVVTNINLPNDDSSVSYIAEITNLDNEVMMIDSIAGLPQGMTYELNDYSLNQKICNNDDETICNLGAKRQFEIIIRYENEADILPEQVVSLDISFKVYTYRISFDANGGIGSMDDINAKYNETITLPANVFTKKGYVFDEWNTEEDGSGISYSDEQVIQNINTNDETEIVLYAQWKDAGFNYVFRHDGACIFNGADQNITGSECQDYWDNTYIDTGVFLYNNDNWDKDFEIGFTIDEYNYADQVQQATFVNTKYEKESIKFPGLVFRRGGSTNTLELTQQINNGNKVVAEFKNYSIPVDVRIFRIDGVIYYSFNNGALGTLQNMSDFNQQFDVTTWFGATPDENGVAMRHLKAQLSNMYIKLGQYDHKKYTVTFDPNGGTIDEATKEVEQYNKIGELPIPTSDDGRSFLGWYTDIVFTTKISENTVIINDTTYYAKWSLPGAVKINNVFYDTLAAAIASVPTDGSEVTIELIDSISEAVNIPAGTNIVFDFGNYVISSVGNNAIIENNGNLKIISGNFTSSANTAAINNNVNGVLTITGGTIAATGQKQAVYNNGGTLIIDADAYLTSTSTSRSTVHNLNSGIATVKGGTIISSGQAGIANDRGTLIIGTQDGNIDISAPLIMGKTYGITSSPNYSLYDGIIKGQTNSVNNNGLITSIEDNSIIENSTEVIDDKTYKTLYLTLNN